MGVRTRVPVGPKVPPSADDGFPASGATAQEILEEFVPLVIKAATDAATGLSMAAAAMASLEGEFRELKGEVRELKLAEQNTERGKANIEKEKAKKTKIWIGFLKSAFTPPVIIQILLFISAAIGLYSQLPSDHAKSDRDTVVEQRDTRASD